MRNDTTLFIVWAVVLIFIGLVVGAGCLKLHYEGRAYEICQLARVSQEVSEDACGALQDLLNIEYLCQDKNSLLSNHCWIERR